MTGICNAVFLISFANKLLWFPKRIVQIKAVICNSFANNLLWFPAYRIVHINLSENHFVVLIEKIIILVFV